MKRKPGRPAAKITARPAPKAPVAAGAVPHGPSITAVVMAHNAEATIARAVASVKGYADTLYLLDTGVTDQSITLARHTFSPANAERDFVERFAWVDDFAAGRNAALLGAANRMAGKDWLLILDTDEWFTWGALLPEDVRARLAGAPDDVDAFNVSHSSGTYSQPRFVRASAVQSGRVAFAGKVHEALRHRRAQPLLHVWFNDEPKTSEAALAKYTRDLGILTAVVRDAPNDQRSRYYLGQTHECLMKLAPKGAPAVRHHYQAALAAYSTAVQLDGWCEEGAWAAYKAATLTSSPVDREVTVGDRRLGLTLAAQGLARYPFAELAWLAGFLSYYLGEYPQALAWARMAISAGRDSSAGVDLFGRTGFKDVPMLWEKPYELAAFAAERLGDEGSANAYRAQGRAAAAARGRYPA